MDNIEIVRGTTLALVIKIMDSDGGIYEMQSGDIVRFGVKRDRELKDYALKKEAAYNDADHTFIVQLTPEDTADLEFSRYWYDVGLQNKSGDYYMIIEASAFDIVTAITAKEGDNES